MGSVQSYLPVAVVVAGAAAYGYTQLNKPALVPPHAGSSSASTSAPASKKQKQKKKAGTGAGAGASAGASEKGRSMRSTSCVVWKEESYLPLLSLSQTRVPSWRVRGSLPAGRPGYQRRDRNEAREAEGGRGLTARANSALRGCGTSWRWRGLSSKYGVPAVLAWVGVD